MMIKNDVPQIDNQQIEKKVLKITDTHIRIVLYGSLLIFLFAFFGAKPLMNQYNIDNAEKCFAKQDYLCAFKHYHKAFSTDMNNEKYVENYFKTLVKMKKIAIVQEELEKITEKYPESSVVPEIYAIFDDIRKKITEEYKETYIDAVVQGTNVVHWNNNVSKIKVFIDYQQASKLPGYYIDEVKNSFLEYTRALDNAIQFTYVNNPNDAHIQIIFMPEISGGKCVGTSDCVKILGLTENIISGSVLHKSTVKLRTQDTDNTQFTANQIHNIAKHEIGHALGVAGHSYFSEDVMYPVNNDAQWAEDYQTLLITKKPFSERDLKTFKLLYKMIPDITNTHYNSAVYPDMYLPIAVLGTKQQIGEKKLSESKRYLQTVSSNFISQMNLAEGYFVSKNFEKAEEAFSEALSYAKTDEEKFTVYHNLAVIYYERGDYKTSISYADTANTFTNDNKSDELKAYCYIEMGNYKKAEKTLVRLTEQFPENTTYSAALAGSYLKQFKLGKMIDEMKRIKEIRPEALSEPVYQPYKFFANFT